MHSGWKSLRSFCLAPTRSSSETARIHHAGCWRGSVAGGSASAVARVDAAHRSAAARHRERCRISGPPRSISAGAGAIGLGHRPQRAGGYPVGHGNAAEIRRNAAELAAIAPDCILAAGDSTTPPLLQATRTVPIVFPIAGDPVGSGYVDSLSRPGGNATGFLIFEFSTCGKWLELLKEIAPTVTRVAVLRETTQGSGTSQFAAIQAVAPSLRMEVNPVNVRNASEIEGAVTAFARSPNGGLILTAGAGTLAHRELIVKLAARYKLPAIYWERSIVAGGGLISYGADIVDQYRRAAGYINRILKGDKAADLPVQGPTKYELTINLKTAKALGLTVQPTLLARADEVIE
jgi:putative ABC transport system substrate-binding protein